MGTLSSTSRPRRWINTVPTDPDDNRVLECAVSARTQTIVTGDDDLLRLVGFRGIEIVRVADFLTRLSGRGR
jgi:predicted nucleic acid-binding protein